jgi:hypothetical protein
MAKLPTVVSNLAPDLRAFINRVREALDSGGTNRLLTVDDLISSGIASPGPGGTIIPPGGGIITTPPTPKNVDAEGAIQNIIVTWDDPLYFGHAYAEVWGSGTDNLGEAVRIGMAPGAIFIDAIGPSSVRYYWVRFVNTLGTAGAFNAVAGVRGETGPDVEYLLETLTGAITETQLFEDLGNRIDLVDGPISLAGSVAARIYAEEQARLAADTTLGSSITTLQNTDATQATQITSLQTRATTSESNIINLQTTTASQATSITSLTTRTTAAESNITNLQTTTASQATSITTLSTTVGANTTAIQEEATTRADETGNLFAKYTVKIDTNGYVSGFGLASTANNATPFSEFIIRADRFSIASPTGPGITPVIPFIVTTTPQTINGVTVPVGVYINGAFIQNGTITTAKIGNAQIDDAKIASLSAGKITAGSISVGSYIQSSNYLIGSQGWKIHGNGTAEFAAASIRGLITAAQIDSRGLSIKDASGNIILAAGSPLSTGNISGLGTLATQSSVNWDSQIVNIPSFGNFAYISTITAANISTYIASAAIGTSYISNAAITNALIANGAISNAKIGDAEITTAKIGDGQITNAKIGNAQITTAKIGAAQVDTLTIAGNAVTVPSSAFTSSALNLGLSSSWVTAQTLSVTTSGARVFISFSSSVTGATIVGESSFTNYVPVFRLKRNSTVVFDASESSAFTYSETPPASSYTYAVEVSVGTSQTRFNELSNTTVAARSLFILETKR